VVIIGATNRPDMVDPALLRPGRFDRIMFTPSPDEKSRLAIFKIHTKDMPLAKDVDLKKLAEKTEGYVGADIEAICREAAMLTIRKSSEAKEVSASAFEEVLKKVKPSVSDEISKAYKKMEDYFRSAKAQEMIEKPDYYG
jgi:transitional endoplasmic reticulum ATPase